MHLQIFRTLCQSVGKLEIYGEDMTGCLILVLFYESKFILDLFIFCVFPMRFLRWLAANVDFSTWSHDIHMISNARL